MTQARIEEVSIRTAGTSLDGDHPAGAKVLYVTSTSDFSELGGTFVLDDVQYNYDLVDFEAQTVRSTVGLVAAKESGERLDLLPISRWKVATVRPLTPEDAPSSNARIHVGLAAFVQRGIRTEDEQESCVLDTLSGELTVVQIDNQDPVFDGGYIDPVTLPPVELPPLTDLEEPQTPTTLTLGGSGGVIVARWDEVPNADIVTYRLHLREEAHPTTSGAFEVASGIGLTSAAVRLLADGTRISTDKTYYGIVTIEDDDGVGPASQVASAAPDVIGEGDIDPTIIDAVDSIITKYPQNDPPWANGTVKPLSFTNDEWEDTNNGNLRHVWSGPNGTPPNQWVPRPLGPGATTNDVVAGKTIPIGSGFRLEWGVANPTSFFTPTTSLPSYPLPAAHTDGNPRRTSHVHRDPTTGRWYAMNIHPVDTRLAEVITWLEGDTTFTTVAEIPAEVFTGGYPPNPTYPTQWFSSNMHGFVRLSNGKFVVGNYGTLMVFSSSWVFEKNIFPGSSGAVFVNGGGSSVNFAQCMGVDEDGLTLIFIYSRAYTVDDVIYRHLHFLKINSSDGSVVSYVNRAFPAGFNPDELQNLIGQRKTTVMGTGSSRKYAGGYRYLNVFDNDFVYYPSEAVKVDIPASLDYEAFYAAGRWIYTGTEGNIGPVGYPNLADSYGWKQGISGGLQSSVAVDLTYTLTDTLVAGEGVHETVRNTANVTVTVPAGSIFKFPKVSIPSGSDADMPDSVYIYARVNGSGNPYTRQLPKGRAAGDYAVTPAQMPIEMSVPLTTDGPQPPAASNFPQGGSGALYSESGGFIVRGDNSGDWPFFRDLLQTLFDSRYAFAGHTHNYAAYVHYHPDLAKVTDLNTEITARQNEDISLNTDIDTLLGADIAIRNRLVVLEAYNAKFKRSGSAIAVISAAATNTPTTIDFATPFASDVPIPQHVSITMVAVPTVATRLSVTAITKSGFTINAWRATGTANIGFTYFAEGI